MSKRLKIYIAMFVGVLGLMMYLEYTKPKRLNWEETYSADDKIPFGAYILAKELPKLFPEKTLQILDNQTIANFLLYNDSIGTDNVFFVLSNSKSLSDADAKALLLFVASGNDVFLASDDPYILSDSLKFRTGYNLLEDNEKYNFFLTNTYLDPKNYHFRSVFSIKYFSQIDIAKVKILGEFYMKNNTNFVKNRANFIKQSYGKGNFYIHLLPKAFGNYFMKNDTTYSYAVNCLNYIDKKHIIWDNYQKSADTPSKGILMYITANPPLHWAWVILIVGTIVYCLFLGKRQQRIIPIINPLKNSTIEFTKTIGNLYYNSREHTDLIQKKIKYFLFFVKENYYIDIQNINADFSEKLSIKSGVSKEITDKITALINRQPETAGEEHLREINSVIDEFYTKI